MVFISNEHYIPLTKPIIYFNGKKFKIIDVWQLFYFFSEEIWLLFHDIVYILL